MKTWICLLRGWVVCSIFLGALLVAPAQAQDGVYAKVVHATNHAFTHNDREYVEYTLRLRPDGGGSLVTAEAKVLKHSALYENIEEILHDTRYGVFLLYQRGNRTFIGFATPASFHSERVPALEDEPQEDAFAYDDQSGNNSFSSTSTVRRGVTQGNSEIRIGN